MKRLESACFFALVLTLSALLSGCVSISERAELADGSTTSTRGLSFWSKTGLPLADSSKELTPENYSRDSKIEGLETDPETETVGAMAGMIGSVFGAQQQANETLTLALVESIRPDPTEPLSESDRELLEQIPDLRKDLAEIKEALNQETPEE